LRLISIVLPEEQQAVRCFIAAKFTVAQRRLPLKADLIKPPKRDGSLSQQPMPRTG
jgi:hypothetical protein